MARDNKPGRRRKMLHAVLGGQVGCRIQRLSDREMLVQIFIQIHVVTGQNHSACAGVDGDKLRLVGMFAAGVTGDAGKNFLPIPVYQTDAALQVEFHRGKHIIRINSAVCIRCCQASPV